MVTGILYSDIFFLRPYLLAWDLAGFMNALHVMGAYVFTLYLVVHLYMATLGRTFFAHPKAMITGYEEEPDYSDKSPAASEDALSSPQLQKE